MKRIFTVQDISCLGRCSLTVALPVISAMGVETAIVPTAVLSTHTMFQGFTCKDLDDQILPIAAHWQNQGFRFDGIYTGYLASAEQIAKVIEMISLFRGKDTLVAVDPAMADNGKLYPAFGADFPREMAKLCAVADVVLPNATEGALLTGLPYRETYDEAYAADMAKRLCDAGAKTVVLTGATFGDQYGVYSYDGKTGASDFYAHERLPKSYHGTGDIFSSCFVGALMRGKTLPQAVKTAADFTAECIRVTMIDPAAPAYGVQFEKAIPFLLERL